MSRIGRKLRRSIVTRAVVTRTIRIVLVAWIALVEFLNVRGFSYQPILPEILAETEDTMNHRNCGKKVTVPA